MTVWWVNQGQTYSQERRDGILWAPYKSGNRRLQHWQNMDLVQPGELIFHYANKHVVALSRVTAPSVSSRRPANLPTELWEQDGRLVRAAYHDAKQAVERDEIPSEWRRSEPEWGPFQVDTRVKLGYLFPVSDYFAADFEERFGQRFPSAAWTPPVPLPAEAQQGARDLVRRLIGQPLETFSGQTNLILGMRPNVAVVSTTRSPEGKEIPISDIQDALDQLLRDGALSVTVDEVGHRSAFVGAVLATIPGVDWERSAGPRLVVTETKRGDEQDSPNDGADTPDFTFEGDLSRSRVGSTRGEQGALRRLIFGASEEAGCDLCGGVYPVRFLWAAHIKRRAVCSDTERRDLANVAMSACVFGCDALFETGFVAVGDDGRVLASDAPDASALGARLGDLTGLNCSAFTAKSAPYFAWHRENVFRAPA